MVGEFVGKAGVKAELFWLHRDDEVVPEFLVVGNDDSAAARGKGIWKAGIRWDRRDEGVEVDRQK